MGCGKVLGGCVNSSVTSFGRKNLVTRTPSGYCTIARSFLGRHEQLGQMVEDCSLRMTPHLFRNASYECINSYDSDIVCRGGLWHFVTLAVYFATTKAELGAVLAAHFNYTDSGVVKLCGA